MSTRNQRPVLYVGGVLPCLNCGGNDNVGGKLPSLGVCY
jgi:hypothetical protein